MWSHQCSGETQGTESSTSDPWGEELEISLLLLCWNHRRLVGSPSCPVLSSPSSSLKKASAKAKTSISSLHEDGSEKWWWGLCMQSLPGRNQIWWPSNHEVPMFPSWDGRYYEDIWHHGNDDTGYRKNRDSWCLPLATGWHLGPGRQSWYLKHKLVSKHSNRNRSHL